MTKIVIDGDGHRVELEHTTDDLGLLVERVQRLWSETKAERRSLPSRGFAPAGYVQLPGTP